MVRRATSASGDATSGVSPLRRAHLAVDDTIERLHLKVKTLLNSPKHDPGTLSSYMSTLEKLVTLAKETDPALRASSVGGNGAGPGEQSSRGLAIVPGIIADQEEWQRQMGLLETRRAERR